MITLAAHDDDGDEILVAVSGRRRRLVSVGGDAMAWQLDLPPAEAIRLAGNLALAAVDAMDAERVGTCEVPRG